jgi:hypothetical protein
MKRTQAPLVGILPAYVKISPVISTALIDISNSDRDQNQQQFVPSYSLDPPGHLAVHSPFLRAPPSLV